MSILCIQIHPHLAPGIDLTLVRAVAAQLVSTSLFTRHAEVEGFDSAPYINLYFDISSLPEAWPVVWAQLYGHVRIGASLRTSSIATCQGNNGWDDYLLLHHFDPTVSVDDPGEIGRRS